jgi:hypothetical protein
LVSNCATVPLVKRPERWSDFCTTCTVWPARTDAREVTGTPAAEEEAELKGMAAAAAAAPATAEREGATVLAVARCTMERAARGAGMSRAWRIADNSIPRALLLLQRPQVDRTAAAVARKLMWKIKRESA